MSLNELWFVLVAVLFVGFFFLEGFDFGVGIASRVLAKTGSERQILVNTIGPFWDANEVWLITAGGAIFAAFPNWYATMFSGYYLPFVVLLLALIGRGVSFEFRGQKKTMGWTKTWDWIIFFGSLLPPFLLGVLFSTLAKGMPIDKQMNLHAGFTDYVNLFSVWGGITIVLICLLHGLQFISLRVDGDLRYRAAALAKKIWFVTVAALLIFVGLAFVYTDLFTARPVLVPLMIGLVVVFYLLSGLSLWKGREILSFMFGGLGIIFTVGAIFVGLFPRVMISSISEANNLTIYNAASGHYSLSIMTIVAVTLLPFVLGYQIWSYYVFRKRISDKEKLTY